jgi:hypothetical protein
LEELLESVESKVSGKDVLLIERFDRVHTGLGWLRKSMVSALIESHLSRSG